MTVGSNNFTPVNTRPLPCLDQDEDCGPTEEDEFLAPTKFSAQLWDSAWRIVEAMPRKRGVTLTITSPCKRKAVEEDALTAKSSKVARLDNELLAARKPAKKRGLPQKPKLVAPAKSKWKFVAAEA